jgi:hypothetical protein
MGDRGFEPRTSALSERERSRIGRVLTSDREPDAIRAKNLRVFVINVVLPLTDGARSDAIHRSPQAEDRVRKSAWAVCQPLPVARDDGHPHGDSPADGLRKRNGK